MSWINEIVKKQIEVDRHREWVLFKQKRLEQHIPDVMTWLEKNIRSEIKSANIQNRISLCRRKDHVYCYADERVVCADLDRERITMIEINTTAGTLTERVYWLKINDDGDLTLHNYEQDGSSYVWISDLARSILKFLL